MALTLDGDNGVSGVNGSAGTPALQGTDTNTGISFGTDTVNLVTGGTTRATVDSSGRLLVGTSTAGAFDNRRVTIATSSGTTSLELRSATDGDSRIVFTDSTDSGDAGSYKGQISYDQSSDFMSFNTNGNNERMRINSSGQVGIGRSPAYALDVKAEDQTARLVVTKHAGNNPAIGFADSGTGYENGHIHAYSLKIATGTSTLFSGTTGVQLANGATSWSTLSDERQKTDLTPIENGLSKIAGLRACTGRYLTDEPQKSRSFLIAQDVQTVLPEAVFAEDDADQTLNLRYTEVIPLLVAALKESKERIEQLETRLTALEGGAS